MFGRRKALEERVEKLERELKSLRLEWEEVMDKVWRWMHRTSKRVQADAPSPEEGGDGLDPVSRKLLQFRNRSLKPPNGGTP